MQNYTEGDGKLYIIIFQKGRTIKKKELRKKNT